MPPEEQPAIETLDLGTNPLDDSVPTATPEAEMNASATIPNTPMSDISTSEENMPESGGDDPDTNAVSPEFPQEVLQELDSLKTQLGERTAQYMRLAADFENFRKRTQNEKEEQEHQVKRKTLMEILPVIDNFDRARSQIKPANEEAEGVHKSYQSIYKQLVDCLKRIGVSPMRSEGKPFDPNMHEAIMREPTADHEEGTVLEELVRGYLLGERVLRHAMVKVATEPETDSDSGN
jgi:molecular chaperone GrpE